MTEPKFSLQTIIKYLELEYSIDIGITQAAIILGTLMGIEKGIKDNE